MKKNLKKIAWIISYLILLLLAVFIIFSAGAYLAVTNKVVEKMAESEVYYLGKVTGKYSKEDGKWAQNVDFKLYWEVWEKLKTQHPNKDQVNDKKMLYGSLKGLVASFEDPYSEFMDPKESKDFEDSMSGVFEGIGAEIGIRDGVLTVVSPIEGTPAFQAGLLPGDKILKINGETTEAMGVDEAVSKIRGQKGTEVILSIFGGSMEEIREVKIIRDKIFIKSIKYEKISDDLFLINISAFNDDTSELFAEAVKQFISSGSKNLILDLRSNPGGYLETAVDVLGEWINGQVAVSEKFADDKKTDYLAKGLNRLSNYNTVVLINGGSASASEILAGALKDYGKATLIGETSYGKGSVQMLKNLSDGSTLKVTVAKWLTPNGQDINKEGIKPDIEVELTYDDYIADKDPQMEAAKKFFK